jgi:hypothetical protein
MSTSRSTVSLVVRLLTEPAEEGRLVGHAEVVDTGEVVRVRDAADLTRLVQEVAHRDQGAG